MSRHGGHDDPDFGSDSFLDIIANIVGILIILIVIAGVKVARQPPAAAVAVTETEPVVTAPANSPTLPDSRRFHPDPGIIRLSASQLHLLKENARTAAEQTSHLRQEHAALQSTSTELGRQLTDARRQSAELDAKMTTFGRQTAQSAANHAVVAEDVNGLRGTVASLQKQTADEEKRHQMLLTATRRVYDRQAAADAQLKQISEHTRRLQEVIEQKRVESAAPVEHLEHRLSPVVRAGSEQELHFRLRNGQISWVPIEPLLEQLKRQVMNRAGVIQRFGRYEGVCGPVGGYTMKYAVTRHTPSLLEGLNAGSGGLRIAVSRWTVTPDQSLQAESVDEALKFGSRFRQVAEAADLDALMTVWLYAADFVHFRRLREFGHSLGLRVAARPLPEDAEITGSPAGSRSSGQ